MAHDSDALSLDVRTETRILQHRVNDAGYLLRPPHPYAYSGYVVVFSSWVRRGGDNIAMRGQRHGQVAAAKTRPRSTTRGVRPIRRVGGTLMEQARYRRALLAAHREAAPPTCALHPTPRDTRSRSSVDR